MLHGLPEWIHACKHVKRSSPIHPMQSAPVEAGCTSKPRSTTSSRRYLKCLTWPSSHRYSRPFGVYRAGPRLRDRGSDRPILSPLQSPSSPFESSSRWKSITPQPEDGSDCQNGLDSCNGTHRKVETGLPTDGQNEHTGAEDLLLGEDVLGGSWEEGSLSEVALKKLEALLAEVCFQGVCVCARARSRCVCVSLLEYAPA
jgi:hypothetical protein